MKLHRTFELPRRSKAAEFLQLNETGSSSLAFDPKQELSADELNWIKTKAVRQFRNGKYKPMVSTSWMRWLHPDHLNWMRKYSLPAEAIRDRFAQLDSEEEYYKELDLIFLGRAVEVFPDVRSYRSEMPKVFNSSDTQSRLHSLPRTMALIKIWPEQKEKIIEQSIGDVESFLKYAVTHFMAVPEDLIPVIPDLVLLFPEVRPDIEAIIRQRKERIRQDIQDLARQAKEVRRDQFNSIFLDYQEALRAMTILESGVSFIDKTGEIQLQPRVATIQRTTQLPVRPHL